MGGMRGMRGMRSNGKYTKKKVTYEQVCGVTQTRNRKVVYN